MRKLLLIKPGQYLPDKLYDGITRWWPTYSKRSAEEAMAADHPVGKPSTHRSTWPQDCYIVYEDNEPEVNEWGEVCP